MRLRTSLILLSITTALPLFGFALLAAGFVVEHENENFVSAAMSRNRATVSAVDAELRGAIGTLRALAAERSLASDDLETFHGVAGAVLATQPSWSNLLLHDPAGLQLVNASLPWGTPLLARPVAPKSIEAAVRTLAPVVDDLSAAPLLKDQLGIPVRLPIVRDGKAAYVLTAVLSPQTFQRLLAAQELPERWVSGVVDNVGRLIARVPPRPVGTRAAPSYLDNIRGADEGWFRSTTLEGSDVYSSFVRSELSGWTVGYAVPAVLVQAGTVRAAWLMGAGIALSLAAAALISFWLSRRISRPMSKIAQAAALLGRGIHPPKLSSTIHEVERLSAALNEASTAIEARDHELRRSEAELRLQAEELRRADANKSQFLALLSHELRNPLAALRNGLTLMRMRRDSQGLADTRAMMERQVAQLTRLIDDLLDVSRIDRGQLELRRERVPVEALLRAAIETARPAIEAKQQELSTRYPPEPLYVDGDPVRLSQVVSNLLSNAAKFTPEGGSIEIAAGAEGNDAAITIKDNGIGFPPEDNRRIFEMFVQLDASRSNAAGGLGIGLTLVRSLIEMHGGRIDAHSDGPGCGAVFTVHLPLSAAPAAAARTGPAHRTFPTNRRILVADDNVDAADSLAQILRLQGHDVRVAYDGSQAFGLACDYRPEVAFIDLNMPGMSGTALAAALRAQPWARDLRLIAVTGMGQQADIRATRNAGFHAHLTKPAAEDDVLTLAALTQTDATASQAAKR